MGGALGKVGNGGDIAGVEQAPLAKPGAAGRQILEGVLHGPGQIQAREGLQPPPAPVRLQRAILALQAGVVLKCKYEEKSL